MRKIINAPESVVPEMCSGIAAAHPELELLPKYKVIKRRHMSDKVALISGGGSGHEPAHAGFVGKGMLDAAVCGDVFASPSQIQVYQAIKSCANKEGILLIIKNYSGDMMNFKNAAYLAEEDGIKVDYVKVNDDIAVNDSLYTVGRRGVAGTVLVHKIAGAAAEAGLSLEEVKRIANKAIDNVRSIGFALSSCTVPAKGTPTFDIGDDEIEFGVGIHGEPGIRREKTIGADELARRTTDALIENMGLKAGTEVTLLINGFGGSPLQELYLFNNAVSKILDAKGIKVYRTFVGNYMTSIDMAGASVSIMAMDDELKKYLSAPCDTPALKITGESEILPYRDYSASTKIDMSEISYKCETNNSYAEIKKEFTYENMLYIVDKMCEIIIDREVEFCELDSHAGDGDFGMSIAKGFRQLKNEWKHLVSENKNIFDFLSACSLIIMEHCGGASGPIWGSAFRAAARSTEGKSILKVSDFASMIQAAVNGVQTVGARSFGRGAVVGDKTLIDALVPTADSWTASGNSGNDFKTAFYKGAAAAVDGAKATELIAARMGRAGTVGDRSIGYPDAGAYALGVIFTELANAMKY